RHPERAAADVIQPNLVAELDRLGIATMLAANAALELLLDATSLLDSHLDQLANAVDVDRLERVDLQDVVPEVIGQERVDVVTAVPERHLRQVIRAKAEEVGERGDLVSGQSGPWDFDHR